MHTVKRAIIMAAGIGERMRPVTLTTPKPLVKVNGVRMIDTVICSLRANGVIEIYVVVGYLKEQFEILEQEYNGLKLIYNPYYESCNNISSLYVAREYLNDVIILDGDQIVNNSAVLSTEFERSGYNAVWVEGGTKEWLMTVTNNIVTKCSRIGGRRGWQLYSVSRWTKEDGKRLRGYLEVEFEMKKNYQIYWDDIAMFCYPEYFELGIYKMQAGDIIEIDSLSELIKIDSEYAFMQEE